MVQYLYLLGKKNYCDYTTRIDFDEFSVAQLIELS